MAGQRSTDYLLELWLAASAAGGLIARRLEAVGIEAHLFALLTHLAHREPVAPSVIASEEGIPVTTLRDNVQRLVDRGLVRRVPNPDDGRSYLIVRTSEGAGLLELGNVVMARIYDELGRALPRPAASYTQVLGELRAGLAAVTSADGPRRPGAGAPPARAVEPSRPTRPGQS
jgi:DNA-binding MarR family transcriptional regulator